MLPSFESLTRRRIKSKKLVKEDQEKDFSLGEGGVLARKVGYLRTSFFGCSYRLDLVFAIRDLNINHQQYYARTYMNIYIYIY